jgi:hypothetical protein
MIIISNIKLNMPPLPLCLTDKHYWKHSFIFLSNINDFFNVKCSKCGILGKDYDEKLGDHELIYIHFKYHGLTCSECIIKNIIE